MFQKTNMGILCSCDLQRVSKLSLSSFSKEIEMQQNRNSLQNTIYAHIFFRLNNILLLRNYYTGLQITHDLK